jgi:hypothetical protein
MPLELQPVDFKEACLFIELHHRHHTAPKFHLFSIGLNDGEKVVAVVMVMRPVSIALNDGWTAEVSRLCTDGTPHAASKLYAAAWRACRAMGYRKLITYTLDTEPGTSLVAAGWKAVAEVRGRTWNQPLQGRLRVDKHPLQDKIRWEMA